jgi:hypothetical protein
VPNGSADGARTDRAHRGGGVTPPSRPRDQRRLPEPQRATLTADPHGALAVRPEGYGLPYRGTSTTSKLRRKEPRNDNPCRSNALAICPPVDRRVDRRHRYPRRRWNHGVCHRKLRRGRLDPGPPGDQLGPRQRPGILGVPVGHRCADRGRRSRSVRRPVRDDPGPVAPAADCTAKVGVASHPGWRWP